MRSKRIPTGWIEKIAKECNVSADWLFFGTGPMKRGDHDEPLEQNVDEVATEETTPSSSVYEVEATWHGSARQGHDPPLSERFGHAASTLREVFDAGDNLLIAALEANLWAFKRASKHEQRIEDQNDLLKKMSEQMERLEQKCEEFEIKTQTLQSRISTLEDCPSRDDITGDDDVDPKASAA